MAGAAIITPAKCAGCKLWLSSSRMCEAEELLWDDTSEVLWVERLATGLRGVVACHWPKPRGQGFSWEVQPEVKTYTNNPPDEPPHPPSLTSHQLRRGTSTEETTIVPSVSPTGGATGCDSLTLEPHTGIEIQSYSAARLQLGCESCF